MYVFEPLYVWRKLLGPQPDPGLEARSARLLGDLMDCKPEVWAPLGFELVRTEGRRSWASNSYVPKGGALGLRTRMLVCDFIEPRGRSLVSDVIESAKAAL